MRKSVEKKKTVCNTETEMKVIREKKFVEAVLHRADIFEQEKSRLWFFEVVGLILAVVTGLWMSSLQFPSVSSDFLEKRIQERIVSVGRLSGIYSESVSGSTEKQMFMGAKPYKNIIDIEGIEKTEKMSSLEIEPVDKVQYNEEITGETDKEYTDTDEEFLSDQVHDKAENDTEEDKKDANRLAVKGKEFFRSGILDSARIYCEMALKQGRQSSSVYNDLGSVYHYKSQMSGNPGYLRRKGVTDFQKFKQEFYDSAVVSYTKAIELDSTNTEAITNRAVVHDINNNSQKALDDYSLAISIDSSYADAYRKRASTYKSLKKFKKAIEDYTAAIALGTGSYKHNPELRLANSYFGRGSTYYRMGKYEKAVNDYDSTLEIIPSHSLAILNKGISLVRMKRYEAAIEALSVAIRSLSPGEYNGAQITGFMNRGMALKAIGLFENSIEDFRNAAARKRDAPRAYWRIAQCYCLENDPEKALYWLRKSVAEGFSDVHLWIKDKELSKLWDNEEFKEITK